MESGEIVRAVNNSQAAVTLRHASRDYVLHPGRENALPFDAMVLYFGDPRATKIIKSIKDSFGIVTWIPDRESEVRRLRIKWGIDAGDTRYVVPPGSVTVLPDVEFTDFDGNRIITVVKDPLGKHVEEMPQTVSEVELLREQVVRQGAQIDQLLASQRPSPVDEEIAASGMETDGPGEPVISTVDGPAVPLAQQAVDAFASADAPPGTLADVPEDTATAKFTHAESSHAAPVSDLTGNKVQLDDKAARLRREREEAQH